MTKETVKKAVTVAIVIVLVVCQGLLVAKHGEDMYDIGLTEGMTYGEAQGKAQGCVTGFYEMVKERFGIVPDQIKAEIIQKCAEYLNQ